MPPVEPMLARAASTLPDGDRWSFEPKWDGFRAIVFRDGPGIAIESRNQRPLGRYFPELKAVLLEQLPDRIVLDGEIVVPGRSGTLDFDALQARLHPARSRVERLAMDTPASFVAFDLLARGSDDLRQLPFSARRQSLESAFGQSAFGQSALDESAFDESALRKSALEVDPALDQSALEMVLHSPGLPGSGARPGHQPRPEATAGQPRPASSLLLTPASTSRSVAARWFERFEGAGLDGVVAKSLASPYLAGQRAMVKVKHRRTADVVVAGLRWNRPGAPVASLVLGLFDDRGVLHHVGVASSFTDALRRSLAELLQPFRLGEREPHPWLRPSSEGVHGPGSNSRWTGQRDLSWTALRIELVAEVAYDQLQGRRFRHSAQFVRWRPDRDPSSCRYDQLDVAPPAELAALFAPQR